MLKSVKLDCRVEKKATDHKIVTITDNLPPNVHCVECMSCGVLGIQLFEAQDAEL